MVQLHETVMGRKLIEHDIPEIGGQLKRIADALEKKNMEEKAVDFLEQVEALTTDKQTADRVAEFLRSNKIWP